MPGNLTMSEQASSPLLPRSMANVLAAWRQLVTADSSGAVIIEFAFVMPLFLLLSMTALELVNLALANMRMSQIAMTAADNLSRAKTSVPLGLPRLREVDINDTLLGVDIQGGDLFDVLGEGRIIVSSLQRTSTGRQTIAWQRCKGRLNVTSRYGAEGATQPGSGTAGFQGMGTGATRLRTEANSAIIFAEVIYDYDPIIGDWLLGTIRIRKEAAFYVRDDRDLVGGPQGNGMYNPTPAATPSSCNVFNDSF